MNLVKYNVFSDLSTSLIHLTPRFFVRKSTFCYCFWKSTQKSFPFASDVFTKIIFIETFKDE